MQVEGYDIDIVIPGYPGKAVCHGGLGWSSVVLLRGHGRVALIDTGSFGLRPLLKPRPSRRSGLEPKDVTDLLLTHSHHDHSVNWTLFRHARIVVGAHELAWSLEEPWGETPVPRALHARAQELADAADGAGRRGGAARHHRAHGAGAYARASPVRFEGQARTTWCSRAMRPRTGPSSSRARPT